ncbi:MAG TPA: hypothetical protein VH350_10625 [Candidatus Sulfotelmatobacter sp.]|nr:hypothetical protein [Candidatus Sulfotelmatobacter sp.]
MKRPSLFHSTALALTLLAFPLTASAQRHGGASSGGGGISAITRPSGVKEEDTLKDFHQAMAVQATSQQTAEFQALIKTTEAAQTALQTLLQQAQKRIAVQSSRETIDQSLEDARNETKKFEQGFSSAQKSGLKEIDKRLAKADSDLEQEQRKLDEGLQAKASSPDLAARAENLSKSLTEFSNQQLALGREMSITLANGQDVAFTLPAVNHPVKIADRTLAIGVSGALEQTAARAGQRTFRLQLAADLTDLQQNITEVLRAQLNTLDGCGQRVAIQRAMLTPFSPAGLLVVQLHFERWTCSGALAHQTPTELAEEDGSVEVKLTASIDKPNALKIVATFGRINATGMMAEALRSGSLGDDMRATIAQTVLSAAQSASDLNVALPPAARTSAVIQSARFQDTGAGNLILFLNGEIEMSNQQASQLATQLNQALSAQQTAPR